MKRRIALISYISLLMTLVASLAFATTAAAFIKETGSGGSYGEINLRSYYDSGEGTQEKPFVITRPRHLYNFSRLQGLGVYGDPEHPTWFQLGKKIGEGIYRCYKDDGSSTMVPYLDMSDTNYEVEPIIAIGSETTPFYGDFNGNNLEIKGLNVYADPQDAGLFGYTAHGSNIHNLFLSDITINTLGYTSVYNSLYDDDATLASGTSLNYVGTNSHSFVRHDDHSEAETFDAEDYWDDPETDLSGVTTPVISIAGKKSGYKYKLFCTGGLLEAIDNETAKVNLQAVFDYFKAKKDDVPEGTTYIVASSTLSLCVTKTDADGLDHTNVIMTLHFQFALEQLSDTIIHMSVHTGEDTDHNNNIGLLIGHCDGSVSNCYVYNGEFVMNDGDEITGKDPGTFKSLSNYSATGIIGLVGDTVYNSSASDSSAAAAAGKDIGVIDFTNIYNDVVGNSSFPVTDSYVDSANAPDYGIYYTPKDGNKYFSYLRKNATGYVTQQKNTVSLAGRNVIRNSDSGIFTIATDYYSDEINNNVLDRLDPDPPQNNALPAPIIKHEDVQCDANGKYYVYYATGEYVRGGANTDAFNTNFTVYRDSLVSDTPNMILPGHHFPHKGTTTWESFQQRERFQNYVFRFALDSRSEKKLYFADLDLDNQDEASHPMDGEDFISKYFHYKLVDDAGSQISEGDSRCGVMLRDYQLGQPIEISSFAGSFSTPDFSDGSLMYSLYNEAESHPAANLVNFEIKTEVANVTVVASPADVDGSGNVKPAALGVYKYNYDTELGARTYNRAYGEDEATPYADKNYITRNYKDPDYAFFMPGDDRLAYFDYKLDGDGKGQIGTYDAEGSFTEADYSTNATIPESGEYGHTSGKSRLYAHTFKLPKGRYCLASATGTKDELNRTYPFGTAKIFYICAQGQTEGQLKLSDTFYTDRVEAVDFIKTPRFVQSDDATDGDEIISSLSLPATWRCYISLLDNKDRSKRSRFAANTSRLQFKYDGSDGIFYLLCSNGGDEEDPSYNAYYYKDKMTYVALSTFASTHFPETGNVRVQMFDSASSLADPQYYPAT